MSIERKTPQHGGCAAGPLQAALFGKKATSDSIPRRPLVASTKRPRLDAAIAGAALWRDASDPRGGLAEDYLNGLGVDLPDEAANEAIRFHADCPFGHGERFPAMICLIRNAITNEPQSLHRIALPPDGNAVERCASFRRNLGSLADGAIKLTSDEAVEEGIFIAEDVEACLAARQNGFRPVWAVISTHGIANFPILPGIAALTILIEPRELNPTAAQICFE
jgi:putative DNA primase/helicase